VAATAAGVAATAVVAAGVAVEVVAAAVVEAHTEAAVVEVHTAVEAPVLTVDTNLFAAHQSPPAKSGRAFSFSWHLIDFQLFAA